jgi:hypothetical protein
VGGLRQLRLKTGAADLNARSGHVENRVGFAVCRTRQSADGLENIVDDTMSVPGFILYVKTKHLAENDT